MPLYFWCGGIFCGNQRTFFRENGVFNTEHPIFERPQKTKEVNQNAEYGTQKAEGTGRCEY